MGLAYYHWFFLAQPNGIPEHLIAADPAFWLDSLIGPLLGAGARIEPDVMADYVRCFSDPGTIAGSCADYRAAASTDLADDDESFAAGQKIGCPVLVLWGGAGVRRPRLPAAGRLAGVRRRRPRHRAAHRPLCPRNTGPGPRGPDRLRSGEG